VKKVFIVIISMLLILSLCACGGNNNNNPDTSSEDPDISSELPEGDSEETGGENDIRDDEDMANIYQDYLEAWMSFSQNVLENSFKEKTVAQHYGIVLNTETGIYDYMRPLLYWGETLDDFELSAKDAFLELITHGGERYREMDLQRESDTRYIMNLETNEGDQIYIQVNYYPDKNAVQLRAEENGEHALLFECVKIPGGYAAQYYYNAVVSATYGAQTKALCAFKNIIFSTDGSAARFDDVEEPPSIIESVPGEQKFIDGATHWLTIKNGEFTGELDGVAF